MGTNETYWALVADAAERVPDRVIVADDHGRTLSARQFAEAAESVAAALDVAPGQAVSWQLPTTLEAMVLMAALSRLGVTQNPIIAQLREREVAAIVEQVRPVLFVAPRRWRGFDHAAMAEALGLRVMALDLEGPVGPGLRLPTADPVGLPTAPTHAATWVYATSGTTAAPKAVVHTDATLVPASDGMMQAAGFGAGDVYPIAWPVAHIGAVVMLTCALVAGTRLVLFDTWDPAVTPERMAAHGPTILGSAQPFFRAYLDAQHRHGSEPLFPHVRACTAGGAPLPVEMAAELEATFGVRGVIGAYGLTEFPMATCCAPDDPPDALARSVGRVSPGVEVQVVDGELWVRGPQRFRGYLDAGLDAGTLTGDGWVRTGDLGRVDERGFVFVTGRVKDVILRNAENISALEVEDVVLRHPDVVDVAVVGVPDAGTGERVCAVVVTRPGATVDVAVLGEHCRAQGLARYKCPEQVEVVGELPRNGMGKLMKQELRDRLATR